MSDVISYSSASQPSYSKRLRLLLVVIIFAGIVGAIIGITDLVTSNSPSRLAARFIQDLKNDQSQAAYNLTSSAFKSQTSATVWQQTVKSVSKQLQLNPTLSSTKQSGGTTTLLYSEKVADQDYTLRLIMRKDKGQWRVDTFEFIPSAYLGL